MSQQSDDSSRRATLANVNLMAKARIGMSNTPVNNVNPVKRNSITHIMPEHVPTNVQNTIYQPQTQLRLENTYSLGPNDNQKFNVSRIQRLVNDILVSNLANVKYEPNKSKELVQVLSDEIKSRVKSIIYKRYKIIVQLTIGQAGQSILIASRSLWNADIDNSCSVQFSNNSIHAVATIYAVYYD